MADPLSVAGLVLGGATAAAKLLDGVLRAKTTWKGFRQNDETLRAFEDDLQLFEFAISTVRTELLRAQSFPDPNYQWNFAKIEALLTNAAATLSNLEAVFLAITRDRSVLQTFREYWRTCRFKDEVENLHRRINTHTSALQLPFVLMAVNRVNQFSTPPAATQAGIQKLSQIERSIVQLDHDFRSFALREQRPSRPITTADVQFGDRLLDLANDMQQLVDQQAQIAKSFAQRQVGPGLGAVFQQVLDLFGSLGFDVVNDQLRALQQNVALVDNSVQRLHTRSADQSLTWTGQAYTRQSEELIDIAMSMSADISVASSSSTTSEGTVKAFQQGRDSNIGARRANQSRGRLGDNGTSSGETRTAKWVHVVRAQSRFDPLSRNSSVVSKTPHPYAASTLSRVPTILSSAPTEYTQISETTEMLELQASINQRRYDSAVRALSEENYFVAIDILSRLKSQFDADVAAQGQSGSVDRKDPSITMAREVILLLAGATLEADPESRKLEEDLRKLSKASTSRIDRATASHLLAEMLVGRDLTENQTIRAIESAVYLRKAALGKHHPDTISSIRLALFVTVIARDSDQHGWRNELRACSQIQFSQRFGFADVKSAGRFHSMLIARGAYVWAEQIADEIRYQQERATRANTNVYQRTKAAAWIFVNKLSVIRTISNTSFTALANVVKLRPGIATLERFGILVLALLIFTRYAADILTSLRHDIGCINPLQKMREADLKEWTKITALAVQILCTFFGLARAIVRMNTGTPQTPLGQTVFKITQTLHASLTALLMITSTSAILWSPVKLHPTVDHLAISVALPAPLILAYMGLGASLAAGLRGILKSGAASIRYFHHVLAKQLIRLGRLKKLLTLDYTVVLNMGIFLHGAAAALLIITIATSLLRLESVNSHIINYFAAAVALPTPLTLMYVLHSTSYWEAFSTWTKRTKYDLPRMSISLCAAAFVLLLIALVFPLKLDRARFLDFLVVIFLAAYLEDYLGALSYILTASSITMVLILCLLRRETGIYLIFDLFSALIVMPLSLQLADTCVRLLLPKTVPRPGQPNYSLPKLFMLDVLFWTVTGIVFILNTRTHVVPSFSRLWFPKL